MLLKPPLLAYKSDNPLCFLQMCQAPKCDDLDALCRMAGVALLEQDERYPVLAGRESIVMLLDASMGQGPIDADTACRAFDADWRNTAWISDEMDNARAEVFAVPELASMISHSAAHGGLRLGGILPAPVT